MHVALSNSSTDPLQVNNEVISVLRDTQSIKDRAEILDKLFQNLVGELKSRSDEILKEKVELMSDLMGPSIMLPRQGVAKTTLSKKIADYQPKSLSGSGYRDYPSISNDRTITLEGEKNRVITGAYNVSNSSIVSLLTLRIRQALLADGSLPDKLLSISFSKVLRNILIREQVIGNPARADRIISLAMENIRNDKTITISGTYATRNDEHDDIISEANLAAVETHLILSGFRSDHQECPIDFSRVKSIGTLWPQSKK